MNFEVFGSSIALNLSYFTRQINYLNLDMYEQNSCMEDT